MKILNLCDTEEEMKKMTVQQLKEKIRTELHVPHGKESKTQQRMNRYHDHGLTTGHESNIIIKIRCTTPGFNKCIAGFEK